MKTHPKFAAFAISALAAGLLSTALAQSKSQPVITPPAVNNGSNSSRAPFPAVRPFDDVKAPDGRAIDHAPVGAAAAVAPATEPVVVNQPAPVAVATTDPVLTPTGRSQVALASSFDAATYVPTIRSTSMSSREQLLAEIEMRVAASEKGIKAHHTAVTQMSADGRRQFNSAEQDLKEKAKALKKSLKAAQMANEAAWDNARSQLASDYEAYASALSRVDTAAGITR